MAYDRPGAGALDYFPCRYLGSKVLFRGPARDLTRAQVAVLGGTESYGKFVAEPFATRVEAETGLRVVNLGCVNAGPDVFLNEPAVLRVASAAAVTVVQIVGAQNLSNRFYTVHPRRNDRFVAALPPLRALYPEVDFAEFNFTRHLLRALLEVAPDRFAVLADELRAVWLGRMAELLIRLGRPAVLLWMAGRTAPEPGAPPDLTDPILIDRAMLRALSGRAAALVEVVYPEGTAGPGAEGLIHAEMDAPALAGIPGARAHDAVAAALGPVLSRLA